MIYKTDRYVDEDGRGVTEYIPQEEPSTETIHYEGTVGLQTPMGPQPISFKFPSEFTLADCFEKFDEVAKVEVKRIIAEAQKRQQEQNLIVTPDQINNKKNSPIQLVK
jgi:hypothetical protein